MKSDCSYVQEMHRLTEFGVFAIRLIFWNTGIILFLYTLIVLMRDYLIISKVSPLSLFLWLVPLVLN